MTNSDRLLIEKLYKFRKSMYKQIFHIYTVQVPIVLAFIRMKNFTPPPPQKPTFMYSLCIPDNGTVTHH